MKVGEYCNREVIIAGREDSIREAARVMREYHVGNVIIVDEKDGMRIPAGILTDRDIVIEILAVDVDIESVNVGDVMSADLITARETDDIIDTVKRMKAKGVRRIPIVNEGGGLEGILTLDDIMELIAEQLSDLSHLISREQHLEREKLI